MTTDTNPSKTVPDIELNDELCWQAVLTKSVAASTRFVYGVKTTGVYCRCSCSARVPLRKNVVFFTTSSEAKDAGFRPCLRCHPDGVSLSEHHTAIVTQVCRILESSEQGVSLKDLASKVAISPFHLHRLFKAQTGVTPKAYALAHRSKRMRESLMDSPTVTQAIYAAGYASNSRFYEKSDWTLGMNPIRFRKGGSETTIHFAVGECWLGHILVAVSRRGVCAILLGDDPESLIHDLDKRFWQATLIGGDRDFEQIMSQVVGCVNDPAVGFGLPLDIRGTAFQQRVWTALQQIPIGKTMTYSAIARQLGQVESARAVAKACAANALAVAIPCHRVIRLDGSPSGYRWGIERKRQLLQREQESA